MPKLRVTSLEDRLVPALYIVDTTADIGPGSLRQAIIDSNASVGVDDEIRIDVATVDLLSALPALTDDIFIHGNAEATVQRSASASGFFRIFDVDTGTNACFTGLIIRGAINDADGGGIRNLGNLTINLCQIVDNVVDDVGNAPRYGGGIVSYGKLTITNSYIARNRVDGSTEVSTYVEGGGGGLAILDGNVTLDTVSIDENTATGDGSRDAGGGLYLRQGNIWAIRVGITRNQVTGDGGGAYILGGNITLLNSTIAFNTAANQGGGVYVWAGNGTLPAGFLEMDGAIVATNYGATSGVDIFGPVQTTQFNLIRSSEGAQFSGETYRNIYGTNPHLFMPELQSSGGSWAPPLPKLAIDSPARTRGTIFNDLGASENNVGIGSQFKRATMATIGSGASVITFAITADDKLYRHDKQNGWQLLATGVFSISATTDAAGNQVVFAIFTSGNTLRRWRPASGWDTLGVNVMTVSAAKDALGQPLAWVVGSNQAMSLWRTSGGWMPTALTGPNVRSIAATDNGQCVVLFEDRFVRVYTPTSSTLIADRNFAYSIDAVSVGGVLTVFAIDHKNDMYGYTPGGGWTLRGSNIGDVYANAVNGQPGAYVITSQNEAFSYNSVNGFAKIGGRGTIRGFSRGSSGAAAALSSSFRIYLWEPGWTTLTADNFGTE